jgi:hypothetical protein
MAELDFFARRDDGRRRPVGAGEGSEEVVERTVFFDDEHDVLNLRAQSDELLDGGWRRHDSPVLRGGHANVRFSGRCGGQEQQRRGERARKWRLHGVSVVSATRVVT